MFGFERSTMHTTNKQSILYITISILLFYTVAYTNANPSNVGCDLIGTINNVNVMEQTTIMGQTPIDANNLITRTSINSTSVPSKIIIKLQLNGILSGGVAIHTSFGELTTPNTLTAKNCSSGSTSLHYQKDNVPANFEITLVLPKTQQNLPKVNGKRKNDRCW